ncbi:MAG: SGNH/GDSL hydrolase family protein [Anaerolineales bacterium]|nr:SGNH/GDSL hydrolase family protein [Anaerolineales bacterium]
MKRKLSIFSILFGLIFLLVGCSNKPIEVTLTPTSTSSTLDKVIQQSEDWLATRDALASAEIAPTPTIAPTREPDATYTYAEDWKDAPIIPDVLSEKAVEIYLYGLEKGNDPHVFSKIGDCGGTPSWFLGSFDLGEEYYSLGGYTNLETAITYFQGSFERYSMAVSPGFNTESMFSPIWADPEFCTSDEGPIQCEIRENNPSIVLIMLGTNDQYHPDEFEEPLRKIVEYCLEKGILPVLSSKPDDLLGSGEKINSTIYRIALEYEVPFWNFWASLQHLPDGGLQEDGAHLTWAPNYYDDPYAMQGGWPYRNLTALQILDWLIQNLPGPET